MTEQFVNDHRDYILREMTRRAHRRPFYSQRAMARDLKLAPSTLTDFLKGRIALSPGRVEQLTKLLGLTPEQGRHWTDLITIQFSKNAEARALSQIRIRSRIESEKNSLTLEQFKTLSEWQHMAVLELVYMNPERYSKLEVTAKELGCSLAETRAVYQRLESQGLLTKDPKTKIFQVPPSTHVGNTVPDEAVRKLHKDLLLKALAAIDGPPMQTRFVTSAMVGLTADQVQRIKESLQHLPTKIFDPYQAEKSSAPKDQLYCFSVQFFNLLENPKGNPK